MLVNHGDDSAPGYGSVGWTHNSRKPRCFQAGIEGDTGSGYL